MKVPLKVMYACQVLAQLGRAYGKAQLPHIEALAEAESIPCNYLVQILNELRTSGLIQSRRGKQGGYALAKEPSKMTVAEVMQAIDGGVLQIPETKGGGHAGQVQQIWKRMSEILMVQADETTIADLMKTDEAEMWYI